MKKELKLEGGTGGPSRNYQLEGKSFCYYFYSCIRNVQKAFNTILLNY